MEDRPLPRGRGALIQELLRKREEERTIGGRPDPQEQPTEAPKPRGRAALLKKIQEKKQKLVGAADSSVSAIEPSTSGTQATTSIASPAPSTTSKEIQEVTETLSQVSFQERETVFYKGETGKPLRASSNYIRLNIQKDGGVFEYEVQFNPDLDAKNRRVKLVSTVVREQLGGIPRVFDGGSVLYLPKKITDASQMFTATIPGPDGDQTLSCTFIYKKKKSHADRECLHLYNCLFKRIMYILLYTQMGRNYYDTHHGSLIPQHKLEVFPGFAVTVDELEDGLMLCLDTQHRVLRTQTAYDLFNELRAVDPRRFKEMANSSIIGSCILTKYNNKTYTVHDIAWDMNPMDTFPTRDGGSISFVQYYKNQYDITIKDTEQPLLINRKNVSQSGSKEKVEKIVCLIPELSNMTGLTDEMRSDFKVMKDVAQYTRITPNQRINALRTYLENIKKSPEAQKVLSDWGLAIAQNPIDLHARQLDNEIIYFGNNQVQTNNNADWNRAVGENKVTGPVDIFNWIVFFTDRDAKNAQMFAQTMMKLAPVMGCRINQPRPIKLPNDRTETYMTYCQENIDKNTQIVVFICPTMRTDRYSVIKKICCTQIPVASQVINSRTLGNPSKVRSIIQKIALQMNCKLGGTLWTVRFPFKGWMICGIDVYHGSKSEKTSVCGFVASMNETVSRWFSLAKFQDKELGDYLKETFIKALDRWKMENGSFPSKVVVIRDGVGDGQLDHCKRYEIEQLEGVLRDLELPVQICFIVVQKRINTRIFTQGREGYENPPPGTIIDYDISRKYLRDFFLVPQNVRQGTVNPTHYIVLHDTINLKPDHTQRLCYKLCHLYYNWPGTIRVPAPCQYAHKLAALVGQHIKKTPSAVLNDRLFYL
ncbi:unnamed protein product [Acanthoscelides obtectus]|uniref:Uncharacterized protein n=1 Tax=Acanthoscelides obtectus TaxID=200917 RepID=A0A9P0NZU5_ACAOB|nr:unnamed protein product [Acanthoscelides obtectus]CAK1658696.1 Piwi-like protein Ago3 [Acanthoscelides obtectus]